MTVTICVTYDEHVTDVIVTCHHAKHAALFPFLLEDINSNISIEEFHFLMTITCHKAVTNFQQFYIFYNEQLVKISERKMTDWIFII